MTLSSSLNASVSGLGVNASKLANISDNIANAGTKGYKRVDSDFASLVIGDGPGAYTAGGVSVATTRDVSTAGSIVGTSKALDLAVVGKGMLPVTSVVGLEGQAGTEPEMRMLPTGSFSPDADGLVRTTSGFALMGWRVNPDGTMPARARDSAAGLEPVVVSSKQFAASPTTRIGLGINLPAAETQAAASGDPVTVPIGYYDNLGGRQELTATFTPTVPATASSNEWTLRIDDGATAAAANPVGEFTLTFDSTRGGGGNLLSVTATTGAFDPATGEATVAAAGGPLALGFGVPGEPTNLTQLDAGFAPTGITKNGTGAGVLTSLEMDGDGFVKALYDTGFSQRIFQVPVVSVPNFDGLQTQEGQTYSLTDDSGPFYLWDSGDGPTGSISGYSLEESSTDLAGELTSLIETQRAYSSNAKVIQTVDEMLQETTNIKR